VTIRFLGLAWLGLVVLVPGAGASTVLDYITFDGIDHIRSAEEPGRVRAVDVERGEPAPGTPRAPAATITLPADVQALVGLIVHAPARRPQAHPVGELRYWLTFWLTDDTTLGRPYFVETRELLGGVVGPDRFRSILDRHLGQPGP
jgi:hypothetical protein